MLCYRPLLQSSAFSPLLSQNPANPPFLLLAKLVDVVLHFLMAASNGVLLTFLMATSKNVVLHFLMAASNGMLLTFLMAASKNVALQFLMAAPKLLPIRYKVSLRI